LNGSNVNLLSDTESPNDDAILIDVRNVYESRIGHFSVKGVPTLLTNTRKYASLPAVLDASIEHLAGKNIFMYCTGGVRCERASVYLQAMAESSLWPKDLEKPKGIYQLEGGIQKYLEEYGSMDILSDDNDNDDDDSEMRNQDANIRHNYNNDDNSESQVAKKEQVEQDSEKKCLFKGKNFVFDPRRFDPVIGNGGKAGECVICACPHDDYDNGFAPSENKEARCCRCRVLVLICNNCRKSIRTWGEEDEEENTEETVKMKKKEDLFCGPSGKECIDEGNRVNHYQIV
jgi:predicted sulfurtransferase